MQGPDDKHVIAKGERCSVVFAVRANGSRPAEEFLRSLEKPFQMQLLAQIQRLCDSGRLRSPDQIRKLHDNIWEIKRGPVRLLMFQKGNVWFATHGFRKQTQKCPKRQMDLARTIRDEHLKEHKD